MSISFAAERRTHTTPASYFTPERVSAIRAAVALVWAAAVVLAIGDRVPNTDSDVPFAAAALLTTYPLIDVIASLATASATGAAGRWARVGAAVSAVAVVAIGVAAFGADAGATLVAFGAWAAASGALLLVAALRARREGRQLPLIISGAASTLAGLSFIAAAGKSEANLAVLGGYMAAGAILFLVFAFHARAAR